MSDKYIINAEDAELQTSFNTLYLYKNIHRVLFADHRFSCYDKDNAPMNRKSVKIHKGVDNDIMFRALDPNGSAVSVCQMEIYARIFDIDNRTQVIERLCSSKEKNGVFYLPLTTGDLIDIKPGLYSMAFIIKDRTQGTAVENSATFFTDYNSNVSLTVEITEQAERIPNPTVTIGTDSWTENRDMGDNGLQSFFYSSAIAANRTNNHLNSIHTFSVNATDFTGRLYVYGTLDSTPSVDNVNGWFIIDSMNLDENYIQFINYTGVRSFTFTGNYMWVRFVYYPDVDVIIPNGTINEISVRF